MSSRVGLALILIGTIAMLVYAISASNQQGDATTLLIGAMLCILGLWIRRRAVRARQHRPQRFQILRRMRAGEEDEPFEG